MYNNSGTSQQSSWMVADGGSHIERILASIDACDTSAISTEDHRVANDHVRQGKLLSSSNVREACEHFVAALARNPHDIEALCGFANILLDSADVNSAVHVLRRAVRIAPGSGLVHFYLGSALYRQYDLSGALSEFQAVVECEPDSRAGAIARSYARSFLDADRSHWPGLPPQAIARLEKRTWNNHVHLKSCQTICIICLDEFIEGNDLRVLRCGHVFHTSCVDQWLSCHRTCPVCKCAQCLFPTAGGI